MTNTILDGGMGQELIHRSGMSPTPLWSTQVMIEHPGLAREVSIRGQALQENISYTVFTPENVLVKMADEASTQLEGLPEDSL
mgnify:CR=1 FL=1